MLEPTAMEGKDGGQRLRALDGRERIATERLGMLLVDATSILARTHLQETLQQMRRLPNVDRGVIAWGEQVMAAMDVCLRGRYAPFGGDPVYKQAATLILNHRPALERLIAGNALGPRRPRAAEPTQPVQ